MFGLIIRAFMLIAPGYFANDIIEGVGKVTGVKTNEEGKLPWWFSLIVLLAVAAAIVFFFNPFKGRKK